MNLYQIECLRHAHHTSDYLTGGKDDIGLTGYWLSDMEIARFVQDVLAKFERDFSKLVFNLDFHRVGSFSLKISGTDFKDGTGYFPAGNYTIRRISTKSLEEAKP